MSKPVVVDASLAAMWAVPEPHSARALALAQRWTRASTRLLAPGLFLAEVTNALYRRVVRTEMTLSTAQQALRVVLGFGIEIVEEPGLQARSMVLAASLKQPTTYDAQYLALAEHYRCEFWTADARLHQSVGQTLKWVKWIGDYAYPRS